MNSVMSGLCVERVKYLRMQTVNQAKLQCCKVTLRDGGAMGLEGKAPEKTGTVQKLRQPRCLICSFNNQSFATRRGVGPRRGGLRLRSRLRLRSGLLVST